MSDKPEFVTAHRLPKGSVWKIKAELVGGTRLEGLPQPSEALPKVKLSLAAFERSGMEVRQFGRRWSG